MDGTLTREGNAAVRSRRFCCLELFPAPTVGGVRWARGAACEERVLDSKTSSDTFLMGWHFRSVNTQRLAFMFRSIFENKISFVFLLLLLLLDSSFGGSLGSGWHKTSVLSGTLTNTPLPRGCFHSQN